MDVPSSKPGDHSRCRLQTDRPTQGLVVWQGVNQVQAEEVQIVTGYFKRLAVERRGWGLAWSVVHGLSLVWGAVMGKTGEASDVTPATVFCVRVHKAADTWK